MQMATREQLVSFLPSQSPRKFKGARFGGLLVVLLMVFGLSLVSQTTVARAASPEEDLARVNAYVQQALTAAKAGDLVAAQKAYKTYDDQWFNVEDNVKADSKDTYLAIEAKMALVEDAFAKTTPDPKEVVTALENLDATQQSFIKGTPAPGSPASTSSTTSSATVVTLLGMLDTARDAQAKGDYTTAAATIKTFQTTWPDVEGQVKTRSNEAYRETENDMALAYNLLSQQSPDAKAVLDRMTARLEPYRSASSYGIFDATIILLREGLEALLVVVALLTFLKKSGNSAKQPYIWVGAGIGLAASITLGVVIQLLFSSAINGGNREVLEGSVGLIASVMLIYVSYWMHSKSSATAWQRYIRQKSTAALAQGSLFGLALLSFLAIFREGGETVLFFLGMGANISLSDLLIGLAIGTAALIGLGVLLVVVGLRIPMGPFFTVASILVFYLCFKFVGTGIHALQIAKVLPATSANYLPTNDFFGLFPTWETTGVQLVLVLAAVAVVVYSRIKDKREKEQLQAAPISPAKVETSVERPVDLVK